MTANSLPQLASPGLHLRPALRRALLAAAETCWVYAVLLAFDPLIGSPRLLSPLTLFLVYWAGLEIGRRWPRAERKRRLLQLAGIALAFAVWLAAIRLDLYRDSPPLDLSWLSAYLRQLVGGLSRPSPDQLATIALAYVYIRGLGFGSRPLTLWFVGFQFRLGVIVLFLVSAFGVLAVPVDVRPPVIVFFFVSLLGIALARIEEEGREFGLAPRWAFLLPLAALLAVAAGLVLSPVLSQAVADAIFAILLIFVPLVEAVLALVLVPLSWLLDLIFRALEPFFLAVGRALAGLPLGTGEQGPPPLPGRGALPDLTFLLPYLRLAALLAVLFVVGLLIARALNRRIMQAEEDTFIRERIEREPGRAERIRPARPRPARRREIEAENIRRIYAALLQRAEVAGLPRRESETPFEYLPRLSAAFPGAAPDLDSLTRAYVAVHYAETPVQPAELRELRAVWQRLRGEIVAAKKGS